MYDQIRALASNVVSRKKAGVDSYVLFLGAGASINSGCSNMVQLANDVLQSHEPKQFAKWETELSAATSKDTRFGDLLKTDINEKKINRFLDIWSMLDSETRYAILRRHLWDQKTPSRGYEYLAHLVKSGYITTILTTNLDNLVEKALSKVGLLSPENFVVLVNGRDSYEEITDQLENRRAPVIVVKLHGSLESPLSYAFTVEEVFNFERTIKPYLARIINQSVMIVGHSMQDRDVNILFEDEGKEIHFVNPVPPRPNSSIDIVLRVRGVGSIIDGQQGGFDDFFEHLRSHIEDHSAERDASVSPEIDGFLETIGFGSELTVPRSRYKNLETLYVKPTEYDDVIHKLEKDHILFIIGEPHMGKTYTALYLLWEYYQQGYDPVHIRHDQLVNLLHRHHDNFRSLLIELFSSVNNRPRIVHFDDPFGETLERRTDVLSNNLETFLELASGYEQLRVVVTSRLNIFNEALITSPTEKSLEQLEKTLRVHTSYNDEVLRDILYRYVRFYKPAWSNDQKIVSILDEKLPEMLPAPHNIEFFVRTSETLNSESAVLAHVEESKKMISALAGWMKHMTPHEQVFLMWIEICSTASIIFPGASASELDIEKAYKETLAYFFAEGYISGIPTMPFSTTKDKFETILLERKENDAPVKLDFVHPSYHEAFWHAINQRFPIAKWWQLFNRYVGPILGDLPNRVDVVQLKMIERYGTINRDLDQLLLLSAESEEPLEQLVALEHMLRRPEEFTPLRQFSTCLQSVISQSDPQIKLGFLDLYDRYFEQLPVEMLAGGPALLFDIDAEVRGKAQEIVEKWLGEIPIAVREQDALKKWDLITSILSGVSYSTDWLFALRYSSRDTRFQENLVALKPEQFGLLNQISTERGTPLSAELGDLVWRRLNIEQREGLIMPFVDHPDEEWAHDLACRHFTDVLPLRSKSRFIEDLDKVRKAFKLAGSEGLLESLKTTPVGQWPKLQSPLRRALSHSVISAAMTARILENYEEISIDVRDGYWDMLVSPEFRTSLKDYIGAHKYDFSMLTDEVLSRLLLAEGYAQYEALPGLLCRYSKLSTKTRDLVLRHADHPPSWWVGAAFGQIAWKRFEGLVNQEAESLLKRITMLSIREVNGAMLAELAQSYFDKDFGFRMQFEPILLTLAKDSETRKYAEAWMDHQLQFFKFRNKEYWEVIKEQLNELPKDELAMEL